MAIISKVSQVYAGALIEIAESESRLEEVESELKTLDGALRADPLVWKFFRSPLLTLAEKIKPIETALQGSVSKTVYNFLCVLADRRRFNSFPSIVASYSALLDEKLGRRKVHVEAGIDLSEEQKKTLIQEMERFLKRKVVMDVVKSPDLIGGLYIRSGDLMIDTSIRTSLNLYKKTLLERKILGEEYYEN